MADEIIRTEKSIETTQRLYFELSKEWIIESFKRRGYTFPDAKVEVYYTVPAGGDWSGTNIEIDKDNPIKILITTKKNTTVHNKL